MQIATHFWSPSRRSLVLLALLAATATGCAAECGNGEVEDGEQCDDGNKNDNDGCLNTCRVATCGDGKVQEGKEACDDGNTDDDDECLS
ncbi:MAG: hypothetical protein RIT45_4069, partial [Pseudomonadota bacterium]